MHHSLFCGLALLIAGSTGHSVSTSSGAMAAEVDCQYSSSPCVAVQPGQAGSAASRVTYPLDGTLRWAFDGTLRLEFRVRANCCPNSDRFRVAVSCRAETLMVAVADTAPGLCLCDCPYVLTVQCPTLAASSYIVVAPCQGGGGYFPPTRIQRGQGGVTETFTEYYRRVHAKRPN
jgi:hypothetical protein